MSGPLFSDRRPLIALLLPLLVVALVWRCSWISSAQTEATGGGGEAGLAIPDLHRHAL